MTHTNRCLRCYSINNLFVKHLLPSSLFIADELVPMFVYGSCSSLVFIQSFFLYVEDLSFL